MHLRDAAFFAAVFVAVLAVGLQLSAAQGAPGTFAVCSNTEPVTLLRGDVKPLTVAQLNPACSIVNIQAAVLGHVPGGAGAQVAGNAVTLTYAGNIVTLISAGDATGNADETPVTLAPNSILIAGAVA